MEDGFSYVDQLDRLEDELLSKQVFVKEGSPFYRLSKFQRSSPQAADLSRRALRHIEAARSLKERSVHLILFFSRTWWSFHFWSRILFTIKSSGDIFQPSGYGGEVREGKFLCLEPHKLP